jgi:C-terminal processing protease CtpA/Prc
LETEKDIFRRKNESVNRGITLGFNFDLQDDKLIVSSVWEDSKAYKEGIRIGDLIISVNGISTEKINHSQWCEISEIFENADEFTIELLKNATGEKISISGKKITN